MEGGREERRETESEKVKGEGDEQRKREHNKQVECRNDEQTARVTRHDHVKDTRRTSDVSISQADRSVAKWVHSQRDRVGSASNPRPEYQLRTPQGRQVQGRNLSSILPWIQLVSVSLGSFFALTLASAASRPTLFCHSLPLARSPCALKFPGLALVPSPRLARFAVSTIRRVLTSLSIPAVVPFDLLVVVVVVFSLGSVAKLLPQRLNHARSIAGHGT